MMRRRGIGRVGRPGLVGTMARTAVVAGTATAVVGGVSRHQEAKAQTAADAQAYQDQQQMAAQQQMAPPPPPPAPAPAPAAGGDDTITKLQQLAELKSQGILTEEEFAAQKARVLAG
jgi:Short C-terminal domain